MSFEVLIEYLDTAVSKKKSFKAELLDISESGMSFTIPAVSSIKIYEGMTIRLKGLESIIFNNPIIGNIRYNKASRKRFGQTDMRFGVAFKERAKAIAIALDMFSKNKKGKVAS